jgi:endogenous inhibitor of DNA gyrase (YacG/DUF329 family)
MGSLRCPTCGRQIQWSEQFPWRPFCSERCTMVDLGAWFTERHAIPGEPADPDDPRAPLAQDQEE